MTHSGHLLVVLEAVSMVWCSAENVLRHTFVSEWEQVLVLFLLH